MGIPMANIHEPTVGSGSNTNGVVGKESLQELMKRKDDLETELSALGSVLDSHGVNMNTSLTTFDGYPRDDIDVAQIRTTRARIIYLKNDHKALMSRIETALHEHFASGAPPPSLPSSSDQTAVTNTTAPSTAEAVPLNPPFAKVNSVVSGSPAQQAGLQAGDRIRNFGEADWLNHENLRKVGQIVSLSEGRPVQVKVSRGSESGGTAAASELQLTLVPRSDWGGRGLLGCHLVAI